MEEIKKKSENNATKVASKWALIYLAAAIIITYAFQFLNIDQNSSWKYASYVPFLGFLFLTQKEFRDQIGGAMTFGEGFSAGFRYSVFSGLLVGVFTYLYYAILSPQMFDKLLDIIQTAMEEKGADSSIVEKTMNFYRSWGQITFAFGAAIGMTVIGTVVALVGAAIFKKERSPYDIIEDAVDPTV